MCYVTPDEFPHTVSVSRGRDCRRGPDPGVSKQASKHTVTPGFSSHINYFIYRYI